MKTQIADPAQPQFDFAALEMLGVDVRNLTADSRQVKPGDTFVAYPGEHLDGRKFISQALARGANAVLWEREKFAWDGAWLVPNLPVEQLREKVGLIASRVYGDPTQALWTIGVTGTNGKTSCAHWLAQSLTALGRKTALMGTLGNGFYAALTPTANTTPDAISLHAQVAQYRQQGAQCVAMEVSSHGLAQGRVNGVAFDVAVLTNLSRDHLDYHGNMESYARTKARLFNWEGLQYAVLNLDDAFGAKLAQTLKHSEIKVVTYGLQPGEVQASNLRMSESGLTFDMHSAWGDAQVRSKLLGGFNASNLLAVLATLLVSGVALPDAVAQIEQIMPVAGRMQRLGGAGKPLVVVDYAHTPDALEKVLQSLRVVTSNTPYAKLICVFGCGGERDKGKRPLMGAIASRLADNVVVTSDNPRGEEARTIIAEIVAGINSNYHVAEDRTTAIFDAINQAQPGDVVLIAGKGHEQYQEIQGVKLPFSDVEVATRALQEIGHS